jgi:hypothetical protein
MKMSDNQHVLAALIKADGWIDVDDSKPQNGQRVITYCGDFGREHGDFFWLMSCTIYREDKFHAGESYKITHWMPAPDAPLFIDND